MSAPDARSIMAVSSELKDAFEAFNILYYPVAKTDGELATACALADDADMAFSVTCAGNMEGTGYAIVPADILMLAGVHHHLVQQAGHERGGTRRRPHGSLRGRQGLGHQQRLPWPAR